MATQRKPRFMIALDDDSSQLLTELQSFTGLSPAQTIQKLFPSHLAELHEYLTWLKQLPAGTSLQRDFGPFLIHNYGPENIVSAIKRLDPAYVTDGEKLAQSTQSKQA